jgi:hypothetical protein
LFSAFTPFNRSENIFLNSVATNLFLDIKDIEQTCPPPPRPPPFAPTNVTVWT